MGVVYRAFDPALERSVAIKVVGDKNAKDAQRLADEARKASRLNHPNVCVVYEIGDGPSGPFIVMELVEGQPLSTLIPSEGLPLENLTAYATQIAAAVSHAHERGVVHRDLKPENVVVTADGRAKVLDFGLAVRLEQTVSSTDVTDAELNRIAGTLAYMAPEVLRGTLAGLTADVWSLGVILYQMAAGRRPFEGATHFELSAAILHDPVPELPARVPGALRAVVERCLARNPTDRYQKAGEVQVALETLRAGLSWSSVAQTPSRAPAAVPRVLVLPFTDLSPAAERDDGFLADVLGDEIITDLSNVKALRVISRTSSARLKNSSDDLARIGEQLKVQYILEGSLRRGAGRVRVNAKLVEVATDTPVWGRAFDGSHEDALAIHEDISAAIVETLHLTLSSDERRRLRGRPIEDLGAYEAYLKAKQEMLRFTADGLERALEHLRASQALAGDNVLLIAATGEVYWQYLNAGLSADPAYLEKARECATRVLAMDPESAHGQRLLGLILLNEGDIQAGVRRLKQALVRDPNDPDTLMWLSFYAALSGRPEAAAGWVERLLEIDPLTPLYGMLPGVLALMGGRFEEARASMRRCYSRNLDNPGVRMLFGQVLALSGQAEEAGAVFDALAADLPDSPFTRIGAFYRAALAGEREKALQAVDEPTREAFKTDPQYSWMLAQCYALIGENEQALDWLERAVARGFVNHPVLAIHDPLIAGLRAHPRFQALLAATKARFDAFEA